VLGVRDRSSKTQRYARVLYAHYVKHGAAAIERLCEEDPVAYIRVIASLVPKELKVERGPYADMAEEVIDAKIMMLFSEMFSRPD
jgi:hypothetical protein